MIICYTIINVKSRISSFTNRAIAKKTFIEMRLAHADEYHF